MRNSHHVPRVNAISALGADRCIFELLLRNPISSSVLWQSLLRLDPHGTSPRDTVPKGGKVVVLPPKTLHSLLRLAGMFHKYIYPPFLPHIPPDLLSLLPWVAAMNPRHSPLLISSFGIDDKVYIHCPKWSTIISMAVSRHKPSGTGAEI